MARSTITGHKLPAPSSARKRRIRRTSLRSVGPSARLRSPTRRRIMARTKTATSVLEGFLDAFNAHDVDAIMSFFAEDCVLDMPRGPSPGGRRLVGREQVREGIQ